jgi:two-component system, LytTR family, response regulator
MSAFRVLPVENVENARHQLRGLLSLDSECERIAEWLRLLDRLLHPRQSPERIAVRQNGRVLFITLDEIDWIEAADNYVSLHCGVQTHLLRETMSDVEARLEPARFVRIHRSAIVNIDRIKELQPWFRGDYRVILSDGTKLTLTKNHREKLDSQLLLGAFR